MKTLLEELQKCKQTYAYGQNHLLDTIIARIEELLNNPEERSEIVIGY